MTPFPCLICGEDTLELVPGFEAFPRVTSDCRPWPPGGRMSVCHGCGAIQKIPDEKWTQEIGKIYAQYDIYHQSAGIEHAIFLSDGTALPRSRVLIDFVVEKGCWNIVEGALIDIGCGNGVALENFSKALPRWALDGFELSDKVLNNLKAIPGFRRLYTGSITEILARYNLVSAIHALEHFPMPHQGLQDMMSLQNPEGQLLIEVPNIETSPFDLIVADHLLHFTTETLGYVVARAGLEVDVLSNKVLRKELTFLGHRGSSSRLDSDPDKGKAIVHKAVGWLAEILKEVKVASAAPHFGLFGSSIASQWLYGALGSRVKFFVDEDVNRMGHSINGIPIISPDQVSEGATVYAPIENVVLNGLDQRLSKGNGQYIFPQPWLD
jgi:2-polyprenyl-3-methyl-5-hydroxy-6-metoxy-1,4-benzoquinol methylase